jgi:methylenetetrahydrofolate dehydrogenase (NADP+)/methenyltetrahydrofolate cyclohydrolase
MSARILEGLVIAERIRAQVRDQVDALCRQGRRLKLAAVLVGETPASLLYAKSQARQSEAMGIDYQLVQLPGSSDADQIRAAIERLNVDDTVTGIMLHLPLPEGIDTPAMQWSIDPYKDIEGVNPANIGFVFYGEPIIAPCTALAVVELIDESGMNLRGARAVVVGQGAIVGRPVSLFLTQREATVTACHIHTRDLVEHTRTADVLVVATGKPGLITRDHVKPGAVVIDVGINRIKTTDPDGNVTSKTVGDVAFDEVKEIAGAITPVPGGVGPVTVTMLLRNTVEAARKQMARAR